MSTDRTNQARYALPEGGEAPAEAPAPDSAPEPQNVTEAIAAAHSLNDLSPEPAGSSEPADSTSDDPADAGTGADGEGNEGGSASPEAGEDTTPDPESDPDDPFAPYGGADTVAAAHRLYEATRTEDGLIQVFIEAGKQLGVGYDRIQQLFEAGSGSSTPESSDSDAADDDPDRPLTAKEFQEFQAQLQQTEVQKQQARSLAAAQDALNAELSDLGVDDDTRDLVLRLGDKYLQRGDTNPDNIRTAIQRGYADYQSLVERERKGYVEKKEAAAKVPGSPSGVQAPGAPPEQEPKDVAEAIKMARERLRQSA